MVITSRSKAEALRRRLNHPIVDADGHANPFDPGLIDYVRKVGGGAVAERYERSLQEPGTFHPQLKDDAARSHLWIPRQTWWFEPTHNSYDRATSHYPRLMYERLDELGIDFGIIYRSFNYGGIQRPDDGEDELRRVVCRAVNMCNAELYREFADRMTVAANIPMHTPQEAIDELEYVVRVLKMKVITIPGYVRRPFPRLKKEHPELANELSEYAFRIDNYGIDSDHNYDPVWAKCVELGVPPTVHTGAQFWIGRRSPTNFMYNHSGHFAEAGESFLRSMFFGGVTHRFPGLRFAVLEGGVANGCALYSGLVARWKKRNREALLQNQNPALLDIDRIIQLGEQYGHRGIDWDKARAGLEREREVLPDELDDFAKARIEKAQDIHDRFVPNFYFGCEADDPMNACAFNTKLNPYGAKLNAIFGSDITHWDVPDPTEAVHEAWELVDDGLITEDDFKDFVFGNVMRLYTDMNPRFFDGTVVQHAVKKLQA